MSQRPGARDPQRFAPVFVLTAPRAYSSVIATMIGQHPELAGLPELKLFLYPTIGQLAESLPPHLHDRGIAHRSPGLVRALAELIFGGQSPAAVARALAWLRERDDWPGEDVLDRLLEAVQPCEAVEKSPETAITAAALARVSGAYPRARYLHLIRHPTTSAASMQRHWASRVPSDPLPDATATCLAAWLETHRRILRFARSLPRHCYLQSRSEDILADARELAGIARWLGVDDGPVAIAAMRHPESSPFARFGPWGSGVQGGNDHAFLADPVPRLVPAPPPLRPPPGLGDREELWTAVAGLAAEFGYGVGLSAVTRPALT